MSEKKEDRQNRIKSDFKNCWMGLPAVAVYMTLMMLLFQEVCPLLIMTGIPCPACGLTRAGVLLLQGEFIAAFDMHAFIYVILVFVLYFIYNRYIRLRKMPYGTQIMIGILVTMLIYYLYRMIQYFPNQEPMIWSEHISFIDVRGILAYLQECIK